MRGIAVVETPLLLSLNFEGPLCAPMRVAERESWWVDYWKDHEIRAKYFNVSVRQLKNPTQWHQGRIWVLGKILVPRRREIEVISRYHDSPAAGHWGISRTVSMVKRNYVFKGMRRKVRAYVRTAMFVSEERRIPICRELRWGIWRYR